MNSPFIALWNVFAEEESYYHLSHEELYLYSLLSTLNNHEQIIYTSIDVLEQISPIKFYSREKESKQRIKNYLSSLVEKSIIKINKAEFDNKTAIIVTLVDNLEDDSIGKGIKGFARIPYDKFRSFTNMIDFYIYFTVIRFDDIGDKVKGFNCSYERWSYILKCSERKARNEIDKCVNNKIIYKNIGDYIDENVKGRKQKKQDNNIYRTIPFNEKEKTMQTKKVEKEIIQSEIIDQSNPFGKNETREHNWYKRDSNLTVNDMYIYLTTNDEELKKTANGRIDAISKNTKGKYMINKFMNEANEMVQKAKRKQEIENLRTATNAIRLKDNSIIIVDESNINKYNYKDVHSLFYSDDNKHLNREIELDSFQPALLKGGYESRTDMIELGFNKYIKRFVKGNKTMDFDSGVKLRESVFKESNFIDEEDVILEMMNQSTMSRRKDKMDLSEFL